MTDAADSVAGRAAYAAYARAVDHLTHNGNPMPAWEELASKTQQAWRAAAIEGFRVYSRELASKAPLVPTVHREGSRWKSVLPIDLPRSEQAHTPLPALPDEVYDAASTPIDVAPDTDRG
jgi:hypothetical protein